MVQGLPQGIPKETKVGTRVAKGLSETTKGEQQATKLHSTKQHTRKILIHSHAAAGY